MDFILATGPSPALFSKTWNIKIWFSGKVKHFLTKDTWLTAPHEVMCHFAESPLPCRQFPDVSLSTPREPAVLLCAEPNMIWFRSRQRAGAACCTCSASWMRWAGRLNQAMLKITLGSKKKIVYELILFSLPKENRDFFSQTLLAPVANYRQDN